MSARCCMKVAGPSRCGEWQSTSEKVLAPFVRCASCCCAIPAKKSFAAIKMSEAQNSEFSRGRLLVEQIVVVVAPGCRRRNNAKCRMPQILHWEAPRERRL